MLVYFDEQNEKLGAALRAARDYFAIEGIHDLRVEIKRLRILFELIDWLAPSFASRPNYLPMRGLFQAAGALRDIDICQELTMPRLKRLDLSEYFNHLKQKELQFRESFSMVAIAFSDAALIRSRQQIYSALAIARDDRLRKRIGKKIAKHTVLVKGLIDQKKQSTGGLHSIRKASKALRYLLDIWQACCGASTSAAAATDQLKIAGDCLGKWRDALITRESVDAFLEEQIRSGLTDLPAYVTFRAGLRRREERLLAAHRRNKAPLGLALDQLASALNNQQA